MNDVSQMLANVSEVAPYLSVLIQSVAGLLGLLFVAQGLHKFYLHNQRGEALIGSAFTYLIAGVALLNLALSINTVFDLLYGGTGASVEKLVAYRPSASMPTHAGMVMQVIVILLQLYGLFFCVSGFVEIRKLQDNRQGAESTFKSSMFRIFGGAALLNIVLTVNFLAGLLGFGRVL